MAEGEVLVVEDDPEINQLVGAYAEICGYRYRCALNGEAAIAEIRLRVPDLVILDVMLPDLDGFEICRQVKAIANGHVLPVIMLTALDTDESRNKGKQCGANAYLTKPFDPDQLMQTMSRHATDPRH
jgi:DNA-binding response OmpR family regulator